MTGLSLVLLVFPGQMALPLIPLTPLIPRMGGCANFGAPIVLVFFFGLAILISGALIAFGIAAIIATALRTKFGLISAVVINAIVLSLLLSSPLGSPLGSDSGSVGLYALLAVCGVIPAAALVLLLSPKTFGAWWRSPRAFLVVAVVTALLLLPGAAGLVALGIDARGLSSPPPAATSTPFTGVACGG